ncbi:glycosyltransferase 25 family member-like [Brevipalpus obovatus]|uniref:glycosyltransferase 25 family member-like n=1 Tax=Brevipalpus obovatus TaxID=246614 RepID=UPI003D9ED977
MYSLLVKATCSYFIFINIQFLLFSRLFSTSEADGSSSSSSPESPPTQELLLSTGLHYERIKPTIQIAVPIHPYSKAKVLPFTLSGIERQDYPKNRIKVYLYFDLFDDLVNLSSKSEIDLLKDNPKYERNLLTYQTIRLWIEANRHLYKDIILHMNISHDDIVQVKTLALHHAIDNWVDYLFLVDSDAILVNNKTLSSLVGDDQPLIAPMLKSLGAYSNYWVGMDERGYYLRTDDYLPILNREKIGLFKVPMINSCILIDMRMEQINSLTFNGSKLHNAPYDDMIAFALSAKYANVPMYIDNKQTWGYIMPLSDVMDLDKFDQDLVDLQFEASSDGNSFPVIESLIPFTGLSSSKKDKLGMDEIYIINLKRRPERLERMMKILDLLGVDAKVWPAVDGKELSKDYLIRNNITMLDGYINERNLTFGEIACFLSHYQIWQEVVEKNYSKVIIFEDDVRFEKIFRAKWMEHVEHLEEYLADGGQVDFVYLGRKRLNSKIEKEAPVEGFVFPEHSYFAIGYMLTSTGAKKLLDIQPLKKLLPVDLLFPILYDKHPKKKWSEQFPDRTLIAFSVKRVLIHPLYYYGDTHHVSDTFNSTRADENQKTRSQSREEHPSSDTISKKVATFLINHQTNDQCQNEPFLKKTP